MTVFNIAKSESYMYDGLYAYYGAQWDTETNQPLKVSLGCSYDGTPNAFREFEINAPANIIAKYNAWMNRATAEVSLEQILRENERNASAILKGRMVRVVRGRNVKIGTIGKVFWIEDGGYGKIGIALDDSKDASGRAANVAWSYLKNCEVADVSENMERDPSAIIDSFAESIRAYSAIIAGED